VARSRADLGQWCIARSRQEQWRHAPLGPRDDPIKLLYVRLRILSATLLGVSNYKRCVEPSLFCDSVGFEPDVSPFSFWGV
jgi:hypothetical protein